MTLQRRIFLRDYEIIASIGIHEFERQNPQRIIVDVSLDLANDMRRILRKTGLKLFSTMIFSAIEFVKSLKAVTLTSKRRSALKF